MRLRPELRPGPRWGSLQCSSDPLAGFGEKGMGKEEWEGLEMEREWKEGKERKGEEDGMCVIDFRGIDAHVAGSAAAR